MIAKVCRAYDVLALLEAHRRLGPLTAEEEVRRPNPLVAAMRDALRSSKLPTNYAYFRPPFAEEKEVAARGDAILEVDVSHDAIPWARRSRGCASA